MFAGMSEQHRAHLDTAHTTQEGRCPLHHAEKAGHLRPKGEQKGEIDSDREKIEKGKGKEPREKKHLKEIKVEESEGQRK